MFFFEAGGDFFFGEDFILGRVSSLEEEIVVEEEEDENEPDEGVEVGDFFFCGIEGGGVGGVGIGRDKSLEEEEEGDLIFLCFLWGETSSVNIFPGSFEGLNLSKTLTC